MRRAVLALLAFLAFLASCAHGPSPRAPAPATPTPAPAPVTPTPAAPTPVAPTPAAPTGNQTIPTFDRAKTILVRLYLDHSPRRDVYCGCPFGPGPGRGLRVDLDACGYATRSDRTRAERIEWEHAVPASKFGRTFPAWREGDPRCVDGKGRAFHGRACARLASPEFARMEADLHNLFPAVGEVNGLRGDLPMGLPDGATSARTSRRITFGACTSVVEGLVFLPREEARGDIARAYRYMDAAYPERGILDDAHRKLFEAWDREDPPDAWERAKNRLVAEVQGNANPFVEPRDGPVADDSAP